MKQLTLRGFDPLLARKIRDVARREGISLNKAALRLLRRGAGIEEGLERPDVIGHTLDHFAGTMSAEEEKQILDAVKHADVIDTGMWR